MFAKVSINPVSVYTDTVNIVRGIHKSPAVALKVKCDYY